MTPNLKISQCLINRLSHVTEKCFGCLYGIIYENSILVLGFVSENSNDELNIQDSFPGEIDLCGIIGVGEEEFNNARAKKILQDVDVTDNPLFLSYKIGIDSELIASFIVHGKAEKTTFEVSSEKEIWSQFITVRLQTRVPFMCNFQTDLVKDASTTLRKQLASGQVAFRFQKTSIYLMGSDNENGLTGLSGDPNVGELCNYSDTLSEGCLNSKSKKKNHFDMDILKVEMFRKATKDHLDETKNHAPIIDVNKQIYECLKISLKVDAVAMVHRNTKVLHLYEILIESLCRNLRQMERCLLSQLSDSNKKEENLPVSLPEPFHFMPEGCGHLITRFYPKQTPENYLDYERNSLHDRFLLSKRWPYFKRTNSFHFKDELPTNGPLINPHEHLPTITNPDVVVSVVRGRYSYYHYMQQNVDDDGWGCAYRSLQTLFSWFRWQGYTEKPVPTHTEIQQCLVDIQDKPDNFLGSRQWIGSTEVSFCLDTMLGVTSRILHASSGEEIGTRGPELVAHFKTQGTPIMIGGGQLAHTIIGVEYNQTTGNTRFLVLDPHYTGGEDLHTISTKGWCGWKHLNFWNKTAYYNMCLPQIPRSI